MTEREGVGAFQHGVEAVVDTGGVGGAGNYVVLENLYAKLKEHVDFHFNTPVERLDYRVGVPKKKQYTLVLDENGQTAKKVFKAEKQDCDNRPFSFAYPLPAYGVAVFQY